MTDQSKSSPLLRFGGGLPGKDLPKVRDNVSAVVLRGDHLWLGGDEGTAIDRMTRQANGDFADHVRFSLADSLTLAAPLEEEVDIEGLDIDGGYLWLIGSHSAKRKKAEPGKPDAKNIGRLADVGLDGNRFTLARIPLNGESEPVRTHASLRAARLEGDDKGNQLTAALAEDPHLGPFVPRMSRSGALHGIPSKDNGFDVEGLAVTGERVFIGLRGPVLRGWAIVLEVRLTSDLNGVLTLQRIGESGEPYVKHFLQLDGLGVRELSIEGRDLLILTGPSMDLDGPVFIYRWKNALEVQGQSLTSRDALVRVLAVPFGDGHDHAEGLTIASRDPLSVLVSYDSPQTSRIDGVDGVRLDLFDVT